MPDRRKSTAPPPDKDQVRDALRRAAAAVPSTPPPPSKEEMLFELRRKAAQRAQEEHEAHFKPARPPAAVPPVIDPAAWERFPAFRETLLLRYANPEHNAALRALGDLLFDLSVECGGAPVFHDLPGLYTWHEMAAAAADLRHLQGFLGMVGEEQEGADPGRPADAELIRLAKLAARLTSRVGKIADAIDAALPPQQTGAA